MDCIFDNERPIYMQLVDKLRIEIVSGKLKPRWENTFCEGISFDNEGKS